MFCILGTFAFQSTQAVLLDEFGVVMLFPVMYVIELFTLYKVDMFVRN